MRVTPLNLICVVVLAAFAVASAVAQHNWQRTITVDPTQGAADHQTIGAAINDNRIGSNPSNRYTVLIYAGEYAENVTLGSTKENVDLVGIDPDAVIIKPSSGDGIAITSGTETSRNNSIRNLTIKTTSGHGIKIERGSEQGDEEPRNIIIEGVTIDAAGTDKRGIYAPEVQDLRIANTRVKTADGHGIEIVKPTDGSAPENITMTGVTVDAAGSDQVGVRLFAAEHVTIDNSRINSEYNDGIDVFGDSQNVTVRGCEIRAGESGVRILLGDRILLSGCHIMADNSTSDATNLVGLFYDRLSGPPVPQGPTDIVAMDCRIEAVGAGTSAETSYVTTAVQTDTETYPRVVNCQIVATAAKDAVYGVFGGGGSNLDSNVMVLGGVITTGCSDEKQTEVWDLRRQNPSGGTGHVLVSGTRFSKWRGVIESAERPRSAVQRTINVLAPSTNEILSTTLLTDAEQEVVSGFSSPDVYRVLSATGTAAGMDQDVYIIGTDWAGSQITDKITLNGTSTVAGVKPFQTVTKIILPARNNGTQGVMIGYTAELGLQSPVSATSDVLQQGRKASAATAYTLESLGTVNVAYATIDVSSITNADSFEWAVLASQ